MRIAVQILAGVMALVAAVLVKVALGAAAGTRAIAFGLAGLMLVAAVGTFALAWKHPALVAAGKQRGEVVMPLGKMVTSFGALAAMWLYNLAILAVLIVLTIRLV